MSTQVLPFLAATNAIPARVVTAAPVASVQMNVVQLPCGVADFERSEVRLNDGHTEELSARETDLLRYLAANQGRPVSRDEILQHVWHLDPRRLITRTIDMHIANLRGKLHEDPGNPKVLFTVRGQGYMLGRQRRECAVANAG